MALKTESEVPEQRPLTVRAVAKPRIRRNILPALALTALVAIGTMLYRNAANRPVIVELSTAAVRDIKTGFTAEAVVQSKEYGLSAEMAGRVTLLKVVEGQTVSPGDLLMQVSSEDADQVVMEAEAAYQAASRSVFQERARLAATEVQIRAKISAANYRVGEAQANLQRAKAGPRPQELRQAQMSLDRAQVSQLDSQRAFDRAKYLFEQGASPRMDFDSAEARLKAAKAETGQAQAALELLRAGPRAEDVQIAQRAVGSAEADFNVSESGRSDLATQRATVAVAEGMLSRASATLSRARVALKRYDLRAPVAGIVTKVSVEQGVVVGPGIEVIRLSTRDDLHLEAEISSEDAGKVIKGMPVVVTSAAYPGRTFKGTVTGILPAGELKPDSAIRTRIIRTRIALSQDWGLFKPGMELDVEGTAISRHTLSVPSDAVCLSANHLSVWVVKDGEALERSVRTGLSTVQFTEITQGLSGGEQVVVSGKDGLKDGCRVKARS